MNEEKPYVQPPPPLDIEGRPLNVLIQLQGTAAAYVRTAEIKRAYDAIIPTPEPAVEGAVLPPPRSVPQGNPFGAPISAGRQIKPKGHYVVDTEIRTRTI